MKKAMVLLAVLMTGVAFASGAPAEGEKEDVAGYILHHVSDSPSTSSRSRSATTTSPSTCRRSSSR